MSAVGVKGASIQSEAERRQRKKRKDDESKDREKREGECKKGKRETIWHYLLSDSVLSNTSITPPFLKINFMILRQ